MVPPISRLKEKDLAADSHERWLGKTGQVG